jgi:LysM repeat protein
MQGKRRVSVTIGLCIMVLLWAQSLGIGWFRQVQAQAQLVHVVQAGENLYRIALRYGTTVEAIVSANDLADADQIQEGQRLSIPVSASSPMSGAAATTGGSYVVQPGDTLLYIALHYGLRLSELRQVNGLFGSHLVYAGQVLIIPGAGGTVPRPGPTDDSYVVQYGDTLQGIAKQYFVDPFALARVNNLSSTSALRVGQLLRVSGPGLAQLKRILVDISEQHLDAYEGDYVTFSFVCSTGKDPYVTRTGEFHVQSKIPNAYGPAWDIWMPHWLGIYWAGGTENGIHALPLMPNGTTLWAGFLGYPVSYGCIVLGTEDAKELYDWAEMGMPVVIQP